jgi:hypothetical protein
VTLSALQSSVKAFYEENVSLCDIPSGSTESNKHSTTPPYVGRSVVVAKMKVKYIQSILG